MMPATGRFSTGGGFPYPRANDGYMRVYIQQLNTLAEITGDRFFADMGRRWRSFYHDVHVNRSGNTERTRRDIYRTRSQFPITAPRSILADNVEAIDATPTYAGFDASTLLHPAGDLFGDYTSYFAPSEEGPAYLQIRLKRSAWADTLVLGLYNVELYPLDLKILVRSDMGPWQEVAYENAADRRHLAYYFPTVRIREIRLEANHFHGQNRLILGEIALGSAARPKKISPAFGSFLSAPVSVEGHRFGIRLDAPPAAEPNMVVIYRHARDLPSIEHSPWELNFIDPLRPNEQPVLDPVYQFRILYDGAALASGWAHPLILVDGKPAELPPA